MLLQIHDHIKKNGPVSAQQLCRHFAIDYSALEPIIHHLQQNHLIKATETTSSCVKKCVQCSSEPLVYYQVYEQ